MRPQLFFSFFFTFSSYAMRNQSWKDHFRIWVLFNTADVKYSAMLSRLLINSQLTSAPRPAHSVTLIRPSASLLASVWRHMHQRQLLIGRRLAKHTKRSPIATWLVCLGGGMLWRGRGRPSLNSRGRECQQGGRSNIFMSKTSHC